MEEVSTSPTITAKTTAPSSLQFKPTSNSGIASCNVHHLLLARKKFIVWFFFFFPQERYPYHVSSPAAPLMVKSFSSENHEESNQIVSCQCPKSLATTAFPAHLLWQPSSSNYNFGSQHTKESFHCSTALCATKKDSLHWISTSFPALKKLFLKSQPCISQDRCEDEGITIYLPIKESPSSGKLLV